MPAALHTQVPEIITTSIQSFTLMVQHGSSVTFGSPADPFNNNNPSQSTFVLARVVSMTPSQARTITRVYEINAAVAGSAVELIPGGISDDNVQLSRVETYQQTILEALDPQSHMFIDEQGTVSTQPKRGGVDNLKFQKRPFSLLRLVFFPTVVAGGSPTSAFKSDDTINARIDYYCNCFVESITRTVDVSGGAGGMYQSDAGIQVTKRRSRYISIGDANQLKSSFTSEAKDIQQFGSLMPATGSPQFDFNPSTNVGSYGDKIADLAGKNIPA